MQIIKRLVALSCVGLFSGVSIAAEDLPGPDAITEMNKFVGDWTFSGRTMEGIPGIKAGEEFKATQTVTWAVPMKELAIEWEMRTTSGMKFSSGRGRIRWDDFADAVINTYMGEEGDQSFKGVGTLIGVDGNNYDWRGHESGGVGESVNYEATYTMIEKSRWQVEFIPTCVDNDNIRTIRFTWERTNEFKEAVGELAGMIGTWTRVYQDATGATAISTLDVTWGPGERALVVNHTNTIDGNTTPKSMEVIYFDPLSKRVLSRYIGAEGTVAQGSYELGTENGLFYTICTFTGNNAMLERVVSRQRTDHDGDTLKQEFLETAVKNISDTKGTKLEEEVRVYTRVK